MGIFTLSCIKATELMEKRHHAQLSFTEKFQLKTHNLICDVCALYEKQSTLIDAVMKKNLKKDKLEIIENEQLKENILKKIAQK